MRSREHYTLHVATAFGLTLAIVLSFQLYVFREPNRIATDERREQLLAENLGRIQYAENCAMCHGGEGEGVDGPTLNDSTFLKETTDDRMASIVKSGVPSSGMPAWEQSFGGPLTDEEIGQIIAFIRNWEPTAPDREAMAMQGDPVFGLVLFNSTCVACHGENGQGTETAPALNDTGRLSQFDDDWIEGTISEGRLARGMPTWGTVLSPVQIRNLVSLIRAWERGEVVKPPGPEIEIQEALHMLGHGDLHAAEHALERAAQVASGEVLEAITTALEALETGDVAAVEEALNHALELLGVEGGGPEH